MSEYVRIIHHCLKPTSPSPERQKELIENLVNKVCEETGCRRAQVIISFVRNNNEKLRNPNGYDRSFNQWRHLFVGGNLNFEVIVPWNNERFEHNYMITDTIGIGKKFKKYGGKVHLIL